MPDEWRQSVLVRIFKQKGDIQECKNYRGIKLVSHTVKLLEWVNDGRLTEEVEGSKEQSEFMPGRSTTDAMISGVVIGIELHFRQSGSCCTTLQSAINEMNFKCCHGWAKYQNDGLTL